VDRNAFLAFALSFLVLSLWMTWEAKQRPTVPVEVAASDTSGPESVGQAERAPAEPPVAVASGAVAPTPPPAVDAPEQTAEIENGVARVVLSSRGATVQKLELLRYTTPRSEGGGPVTLIDRGAGELAAFATPLAELGFGDLSKAPYQITEQGPRQVSFEYTHQGVRVRKTFSFEDESYRFKLVVAIANQGTAAISPTFAVVIPEVVRPSSDFKDLAVAALVAGTVDRQPVASFGRAGFLRGAPTLEREFSGEVEWVGAYSHYFVSAILPDSPREIRARWQATEPGHEILVSLEHPPAAVLPGTTLDREYVAFVGPKVPELLAAAGGQLERSIELGWSFIAPFTRVFTWLLKACYQVIPNYGIAIIVLTALVRLATSPLAARQMRSMKRMGELQPQIKALQEKYADDRQQQSQEMMKLYREAGVNPLGGCLPLLLQFPVLIGLYYALQSSIDLRQASFGLWIDDLSRPETLFTIPGVEWPVRVLPILMTLSMVAQQRMTPTTSMDPAQARMMMIVMPVMFFFMFYGFPSGLVLYWFVSNLLAIAQQVYLNRQMSPRPA